MMSRKSTFRPRLETLEDRLPPGNVWNWLSPSLSLGSGLSILDPDLAPSSREPRWVDDAWQSQPSAVVSRDADGANSVLAGSLVFLERTSPQGSTRDDASSTFLAASFGEDHNSENLIASNLTGDPLNNGLFPQDTAAQTKSHFYATLPRLPESSIAAIAGQPITSAPSVVDTGTARTPVAATGVPTTPGNVAAGFFSFDVGGSLNKALLTTSPANSPGGGAGGGGGNATGITDPYTLHTYGDGYTGSSPLDRQSFLRNYHPDPSLLDPGLPPISQGGGPGGGGPGDGGSPSTDPGTPGPLAVTNQDYNFGNTAFTAPGAPGESVAIPNIELIGRITAPTDLTGGPRPVVVLLHGRHATTYNPVNGQAFLEWPPTGNHLSITSYLGYQYLADNLASHGYIVDSISANGINARDNGVFDLGAVARAQLLQRSLDILRDLNTGSGIVAPFGVAPFGTRYVSKIDLQNVGTMGHSRGGEGVVRHYLLNQSLGSPYGIKAVFDIAPVDFNRRVPSNVPLVELLSYNDGDVSDLQGIHFYDDARYANLSDPAPKYTFEVMGGNHNFYNTVWSPGLFPFPGAPAGFGGTFDEGVAGPPTRLTESQQQGVGLAYMAAFFRTYVGDATVPAVGQFAPILRGDVAPPPSSTLTPDQMHVGYQAGAANRRDINRLLNPGNLTVNALGGAVTTGGLTTYEVYGDTSVGEVAFRLPGEPSSHFPHTIPSARSSKPGLSILHLNYQNTVNAFYQNNIPVASANESGFYDLQFRVNTEYTDPRNKPGDDQDFSVTLTDRGGTSFTTQVSLWSRALFYPPGNTFATPHDLLNTVRIPLAGFTGVDLTNVASVRFNFDQRRKGAFLIDDLAFADPTTVYAGPFVVSTTPLPNGRVLPGTTSIQVAFNTPIDPTSFTTGQVSLTGPGGPIPVTSVTPVAGSSNSRFDVGFDPLGTTGVYTLVVGPHIRDTAGHEMDQDFKGIPGETPGDQFVLPFGVSGLQVIASTPSGDTVGPINRLRVTLNEPADPATFTPDKVASFTGPGGPITVTGVTPVDGSGFTQFDITFAPQNVIGGTYRMVIGPDIRDFFGNPMDQNDNLIPGEPGVAPVGDQYAATFKIVPRYVASATSFENNVLHPNDPGVVAMPFLGPPDTVPPSQFYADENFGIINLGANTFNFFGTSLTGNNQLFVSSEGLITIGATESPNDFNNTDLTDFPPEPTIAPLWTDYIKEPADPGGPEVLYKFDSNRLIIEWNQTKIFPTTPLGITFQAILQLNTGANAGDITYNYIDLNNGSFDTRLATTTGIKDAGTQTGDGRLLEAFGTLDPLIGSNKAIRIHA
jgi:hypothetical protein